MKLEVAPAGMERVDNLPADEARAADAHDVSPAFEAAYDDPFDDVFGPPLSGSGALIGVVPASESQAGLEPQADENDAGAGADGVPGDPSDRPHNPASAHPSDMHRLQREHRTAGYREGISTAKGATVQKGFDEGFSLGATIGLAAGRVLGTLEGIAEAFSPGDGDEHAAADRLATIAREELAHTRIFSAEYWAPDGNWKFPVVPDPGSGRGEDEILFADVARSHPLISKWMEIARREVQRYGVDEALGGGDHPQQRQQHQQQQHAEGPAGGHPTLTADDLAAAPTPVQPTPAKKSLDW